jgi:hypothetical protein
VSFRLLDQLLLQRTSCPAKTIFFLPGARRQLNTALKD